MLLLALALGATVAPFKTRSLTANMVLLENEPNRLCAFRKSCLHCAVRVKSTTRTSPQYLDDENLSYTLLASSYEIGR